MHRANFNQTWHKLYLGEREIHVFQIKGLTLFKLEITTKWQKWIDEIKKSSPPEPLG